MYWSSKSSLSILTEFIVLAVSTLFLFGCPGSKSKPTLPIQPQLNGADVRCVRILYDRSIPIDYSIGPAQAILLSNTLSHFHFDEKIIQAIDTYLPGQLHECSFNFYLGTVYNNPLPPAFLADAVSTASSLVWMGYNIWQMGPPFQEIFQHQYLRLSQLDYLHRDVMGYPSFFSEIVYKQTPFTKFIRRHAYGQITAAHEIALIRPLGLLTQPPLAFAVNPASGERVPYIVQARNKYYVAESPFSFLHEGDRVNILTDLLFQILGRSPVRSGPRVGIILSYKANSSINPSLKLLVDELARRRLPYFFSYAPSNLGGSTPVPQIIDTLILSSQGLFWDIQNLNKGISRTDWHFQLLKQQEGLLQKKLTPISILDAMANHTLSESMELANLFPLKVGRAEAFALMPPILTLKEGGRKPFLFPVASLNNIGTMPKNSIPYLSANYHHHQFNPYIVYGDIFGQNVISLLGSVSSNSDTLKLNQDINSVSIVGDSLHFIQIPLDDANPVGQLQNLKQILDLYQSKQFNFIDRSVWQIETRRQP